MAVTRAMHAVKHAGGHASGKKGSIFISPYSCFLLGGGGQMSMLPARIHLDQVSRYNREVPIGCTDTLVESRVPPSVRSVICSMTR